MGINFCVEESQAVLLDKSGNIHLAEFVGGVERRRGYIKIRCV